MNSLDIIDISGNKVSVKGIYYISNNNYYFIYSKGEIDNDKIVLYVVKILQEVTNTVEGPKPTGFLIGVRINDDNEYNLVKIDISNIVSEKTNNTEAKVRYLDLSMLSNLKIKDNRIFKLSIDLYNKMFNNNNMVLENAFDYKSRYEELLKENEELKKKIDIIKDIIK